MQLFAEGGGMTAVQAKVLGTMVLSVAILPGAFGQIAVRPVSSRGGSLKSSAANLPLASTSIVREINDPHSGVRWLLLVNTLHPGEPGRLVRADTVRSEVTQPKVAGQTAPALLQLVIHAGERVLLEEHSQVVDARLDAIALNPAAIGGVVRVRLVIGGRVVRSLAVEAGRVVLDQEKEGRP
jgi:hypothetical protein